MAAVELISQPDPQWDFLPHFYSHLLATRQCHKMIPVLDAPPILNEAMDLESFSIGQILLPWLGLQDMKYSPNVIPHLASS